jgi:hypothetical protein
MAPSAYAAVYDVQQTEALNVVGCVEKKTKSVGVMLSPLDGNALGTFTHGGALYVDEQAVEWRTIGDPVTVTVTRFDDVGGLVEGTYSVVVRQTAGGPSHQLSGSFSVCRGPNFVD